MEKKSCASIGLILLICLTILINLCGVFYPILRNDDPPLYANIAKHIVLSGDWVNLISNGHDWLDKPHFPFWLTAISFKVFGINSFAYILPGFLFHLVGAYFTYKLAQALYENSQVGLIAAVIYLSALHLLMSSIDVRAEAYLLGEIMGACYYWYLYNKNPGITFRYLIGGAVFTALAFMTKGLFTLVTITSGLIFMWTYTKNLTNLFKLKWLIALILSLLLIIPEIYVLYLQFDIHPEKLIFNQYGISGIKFFFWDSQFGRFFNNGPITVNHTASFHYLFFVHTFFWAFLPWSLLFVYVVWANIKALKNTSSVVNHMSFWYLCGSFFPTFILFSCTTFQLDHYTNILMPFAAILCAKWLYTWQTETENRAHPILYCQIGLAYCLTILTIVLTICIFGFGGRLLIAGVGIVILTLFIYLRNRNYVTQAILYPSLSIGLVFLFMLQVNQVYAKYDLGYQANLYLKNLPKHTIVDYKVNSLTLEFYANASYMRKDNIDELNQIIRPYYLIIKDTDLVSFKNSLGSYTILYHIYATTIDKVMANLLTLSRLNDTINYYDVIEVR